MRAIPDEDRDQGFVRPLRRTYIHICNGATVIPMDLAKLLATQPNTISTLWCQHCKNSYPVAEFAWKDGDSIC